MFLITVCAAGGTLLLVFLVRRFVRHRQTLAEYREESERHVEAMRASIKQINDTLAPGEALHPVLAGLRELQELEPALFRCRLEEMDEGTARMHVESAPPRVVDIAWRVRTSHLSPGQQGRAVQGQGRWELREGEEVLSFTELGELMRALKKILTPHADPLPSDASEALPFSIEGLFSQKKDS